MESKYTASRAGGGVSSIQKISLTIDLAYQANECATELASRLTKLKDLHLELAAKHGCLHKHRKTFFFFFFNLENYS